MKNTKFLLAIFCLMIFVMVQAASASTITIGSDKFLTIDGKKTFVVGAYQICAYGFDNEYGNGNCPSTIQKLDNFTLSVSSFYGESGTRLDYLDSTAPYYANKGIYWDVFGKHTNIGTRKDNPYFFGYYNFPDEIYMGSQFDMSRDRYEMLCCIIHL